MFKVWQLVQIVNPMMSTQEHLKWYKAKIIAHDEHIEFYKLEKIEWVWHDSELKLITNKKDDFIKKLCSKNEIK